MPIWNDRRMLHSVTGHDSSLSRHMHRATIKGDYGLGGFKNVAAGRVILEMTI